MINPNTIVLTNEKLDELGALFIKNNILDKYGITFIAFIEAWKKGKLEQYI